MLPLKLAVATAPLQLPVKQAIETAARMGVRGVMFDTRSEVRPVDFGDSARRQLLHYLHERELSLGALSCSLRHPLYERDRMDHRIELVRGSMVFASQLKVKTLTVRAGRIPTEGDHPDRVRLIEILRDLAAFGNHLGVVPTVTVSDDSAETLLELTKQITEGPVQIDFDPVAFLLNRRSPIDALRTLYHVVGHIQVRDGRRDEDGTGVESVVGQGEIRWDEIVATAAEMNFGGWMTIRRTAGEDKVSDSVRAVKLLKQFTLV